MRLFEAIRRRKATSASVAVVVGLSVAVATMAFVYEGVETADVELNDGGVWVTKPSGLLLGHLNYPAQVIDGGLRTGSTEFDVLQQGSTVLLLDSSGATLTPVNPMTVALETPVNLPPESSVSLGGPTVSLLDRETGSLYASPASQAGSFVIDPEEPLASLGAGSAVVTDVDGNIHALSSSENAILTFALDETGALPEEPVAAALPEIDEGTPLALTAVGDQPVLFDSSSGTVHLPGGIEADIPEAEGGVLQDAGPASSDVLIASATALIRQPLDGGEATIVQTTGEPGEPAAPAFLNGCAYAAWAGSGDYLRDCSGDANDIEQKIDGLAANADLRFRVNRDVIVLNDLSTGVVYLVNQDMKKVDNWDDIAPPPEESDSEEEEDSTEEELQVLLPDRTEENTPPEAVDDDFGVRAGRTVILPVLDNDIDPDGDVLTATLDGGQPVIGEVQRILNGAALQIVVSADAEGTGRFSYTADDGRGGTDTAVVSLTVRPESQNTQPDQKRVSDVLTEVGATVRHNILPDMIDPDGDDLYVVGASTGTEDQVQYRPDGEITFTSINTDTGPKDVTVIVSDGRSESESTIRFQARDAGSLAPTTNIDLVVTSVGERVTVAPLENDLSPSGAPLRLAKVNETPGGVIEADYTTGIFDFTAANAGQYYVQYLISDGPKTAEGLVRIDVVVPDDTEATPIPVRDTAQLPTGRSTLVNVLANDTDPDGGILAVQSVQVPTDVPVTVEVLEHEILRITDRGLVSPITINYTVSNGAASARGEVFITPIPAPEQLLPPVSVDDSVTVRAGDVATIPVLANDYHPNGDTITLSPTLIEPVLDPLDGEIFVAEDVVRFKAGTEAKTVYATYEVVDSQGQKDAGYITIRIVAPDAGTNSPPRPEDVTIRALQGTSVRIPVSLDGIDPDGDSVRLIGQDSAPAKGRITEVGEAWLVYEAYPSSVGTDTFTYEVRDKLGASATATALVGIIPASESNQPPFAVKDLAAARPGRTLAVDVMSNDTDPDGDPIAIRENGLEVPEGIEASVVGGRVMVTAPTQPGDYTILYTIVDRWGATGVGSLLLSVSPDAPLASPIARDDSIPTSDALDRPYVDMDVRANDDDPDGIIEELTVSVPATAPNATASAIGDGLVRVELLPISQIITYTVTDQDGQSASAFVYVPGIDEMGPVLRPGIEPILVNDGETATVELEDYVLVAAGKTARITEAATVRAAMSNGAELLVDENTLSYTPKERYDGPDALSFEVTDGTGPDDPAGKKSMIVIPIEVASDYNTPPTFVGASVDVAAGDGEGTVDLRANSQDPDEGELEALTFELAGTDGEGVSARIDGATLVVTAAADAPRTASAVQIDVSDGVNLPVRGTVTVNVLSTTRNPPSATDDVVPQANQGETVSVPVLANDYNPFPETPLTITETVVETGNGTASASGSEVSVTPAADFVGTMVVRYTVQDATGDAERAAEGRIRLTVQGRPGTPATPTVTSIQDRTVVLSWTPPVNNGAEITGYTVTSQNGFTQQCASTTCTLSGLTNDVEYYFTVTATNSVGTSDPSPSSGPARPDARPDQPQPPTLVFGDESLAVTWVTPPTPGSAVQSFNLEISPAPDRGAASRYNVTGNTLTWEGLANGTAYQVRVQAVNRAPEPSEFSAWSAFEIPARAPDAPGAPTTSRVDSVGDQTQMNVAWAAPAANGDAISKYIVTLNTGEVREVGGESTSLTIAVANSETDYTFTVAGVNKAGRGADSPPSSPRRAFTPPGAPTLASAVAGDNTITISWSPGATNGARAGETVYQYDIGRGWENIPADNVLNAPNNGTYSVVLQAVSSADGSTYPSPRSNSIGGLTPAGAYGTPNITANGGDRSISYSWDAPARNGRDYVLQTKVDGQGWVNRGMQSGRDSVAGMGYSEERGVSVRMLDAAGAVIPGTEKSTSARTDPEPINTTVSVSKGPPQTIDTCTSSTCRGVNLSINSGAPNATYTINYRSDRDSRNWLTYTITTDGNGNASTTRGVWGYPGNQVWAVASGPDGTFESNRVTW
ncbi:Ig-like domain-containing protein [Herbiconiux liukaitaii]|uniref:Ig-like domain-containing protein n=1 Tax=Herbiconiux liukaitaii TaxID=3342799 RepID=UPI0035BA3686